MIPEVRQTTSQADEGRSEQRTKYKTIVKNPKSNRQLFASLIKRASARGQSPASLRKITD
jgi:hypothetical protein